MVSEKERILLHKWNVIVSMDGILYAAAAVIMMTAKFYEQNA